MTSSAIAYFDGTHILSFSSHFAHTTNANNIHSRPLFDFLSESYCATGLISGIAGSMVTKNPLPLLLGLCECFPKTQAQKKIGNEFQVNTYTNQNQTLSSITNLRDGNFVVTWTSLGQDTSRWGIFGQVFTDNGSKIANEFQVNTYTNLDQDDPSVTSLSNGNFVVAWNSEGQDGSEKGIFGQVFSNTGSKIGTEFLVNTYTSRDQSLPLIKNLNNGNFVVTWESDDQDGWGWGIFGQVFSGTGSKIGTEFRVNTETDEDQNSPSIRLLSNNNFVVTWKSFEQDGSGNDWGSYGQLFSGNGNKIGNEFQVNTYTRRDQTFPLIKDLSNGNFVVIWESDSQDGWGWGIYGQVFYDNGSKIGNEFLVNTYIINDQNYPVVTSLGNSNFVVIWNAFDHDGSGWGVFGQLFASNGSKIGPEFQVNTYTNLDQTFPSIINLSNSTFVVLWNSAGQDSSGWGVFGQLFAGNGSKIGTEFQVNTYANLDQDYPVATSLMNGNFVVTWSSYDQDSSELGVFGQMFHDNITFPVSTTSSSISFTTSSSTSPVISSLSSTTTSSSTTSVSTTSVFSSSRSTSSSTTDLQSVSSRRITSYSNSNNRFSWFLLGGIGAVACTCTTIIGYLLLKRFLHKDNDALHEQGLSTFTHPHTATKRTEGTNNEEGQGYSYTPDCVTPESARIYA